MNLAWRVEGSVTIVAALKPGDGPRSPAGWRTTGVPRHGACGTVAEHKYPPPGDAARGLDTAKKLLSWTGVHSCATAEAKTNGLVRARSLAGRCGGLRRSDLWAPRERRQYQRRHKWGDEPCLAGRRLGDNRRRAQAWRRFHSRGELCLQAPQLR